MSAQTRYPVPAERHRAEQMIERSRFLCTLQRVTSAAEAQAFIREMNAEFADATHNCWAYVAGPPGSTTSVGMSDAGEPHGTAGRPMLTVLLHCGIGEIAAVVTRWYGGTKLGTGGLVKAYGGAVQAALEELPRAERVDYVEVELSIAYGSITVIRQALAALKVEVDEERFGVDVELSLRVPRVALDQLRSAVADGTRGQGIMLVTPDDDAGAGA